MNKININDIVGCSFNKLYVDSYAYKNKGFHFYNCTCDCGNKCIIRRDALLTGKTKSCGCYNIEIHTTIDPTDLLYKKLGRLYVIDYFKHDNHYYYYNCICDCGNKCIIRRDGLLNNLCPSCGCYAREISKESSIKHNISSEHHDFYNVYSHMIHRCLNPKDSAYDNYGGRGIFVCKEWIGTPGYNTTSNLFGLDGLLKFKEDMLESYLEHKAKYPTTQIDRINNNDGYYKENCRWVTCQINARNRRSSLMLNYNGEYISFQDLYDKYCDKRIPIITIYHRIYLLKWSIYNALYTPVDNNSYSPIFERDINSNRYTILSNGKVLRKPIRFKS